MRSCSAGSTDRTLDKQSTGPRTQRRQGRAGRGSAAGLPHGGTQLYGREGLGTKAGSLWEKGPESSQFSTTRRRPSLQSLLHLSELRDKDSVDDLHKRTGSSVCRRIFDGLHACGEVRCSSQKPDAGFLCHENTTSLLSVFGPGNRQHVRRLKSNGTESRGRKGFTETLPYRQTAGGSCHGKEGEHVVFGPNGSGHAVVQPGTAGNRWKVVGSLVESRGGDEWRCHGR